MLDIASRLEPALPDRRRKGFLGALIRRVAVQDGPGRRRIARPAIALKQLHDVPLPDAASEACSGHGGKIEAVFGGDAADDRAVEL